MCLKHVNSTLLPFPEREASVDKDLNGSGAPNDSTDSLESEGGPKGKSGLAFVLQKLVTKEDPFMVHKVGGIFALYSFAYRYGRVWPRTGTLGFVGSRFDWFTMFMHLLLSASAIQFRVPSQRQARRPTMIWHEYRVHAILFTARCVCVYLLGFFFPRAGAAVRWATTMLMHVFVDRVTAVHGKEGETTIRGRDNTTNPFITVLRRVYSLYQFLAVASHVTPSPHAMDLGYNTIIAIQSSAFLMTLNRKGLASWQTHYKFYTAALVISAGYMVTAMVKDHGARFGAQFVAMTGVAFLARSKLGLSKYPIWAAYAVASAYLVGGAAAVQPKALFALDTAA